MEKNENGVLKVNKYLALGVTIFVLVGFIFTAFAGVALKAYQIEQNRCNNVEMKKRIDEMEKTLIRYSERQEQIKKSVEKILEILEKK